MKTLIYFLLSFIYVGARAQTPIKIGKIKAKHEIFIIHELRKLAGNDSPKIVVYSESNKYNNGMPQPKNEKYSMLINPQDLHMDVNLVKPIVFEVLSNKLQQLKANKETLVIIMNFTTQGEACDVSFSMKKNTVISIEDIEEIDSRLRKTIHMTFIGQQYKNHEVLPGKFIPTIDFNQ